VTTAPDLREDFVYAKERKLIEDIRGELRQGRRCQVYATFTGEHDVAARLERVLRQAGLRVAVLRPTVPTLKRELWYEKQLKDGVEVVTGRRQEKVGETVKKIGKGITGVQGDVAKMGDLDRLFKQIEQEKGKLDIVFANAGAAEYAPFGQVDEAHFDRMFDGNVKGVPFSVQKALPLMPDEIFFMALSG
jgi:hypothetical protein